jgi:Sigma-70, region 4/Bacterial RNA polymerase, alpha chain C terminal domain
MLVASARDNSQSQIHEVNDYGNVEQAVPIYIPVEHRGKSLAAYHPSVRLRNVCRYAGIRVLGQLNGRTLVDFGKLRNCGKKTVIELQQLVRRLQGVADVPQVQDAARHDPNVLNVNKSVRSLSLNELPMSKRLESVLSERGWHQLDDLHGVNTTELLKARNCGRKTISELKQLLARADAGEFTPVPSTSSSDPLTTVVRLTNAGMGSVIDRDREIVRQRLFGEKGGPRTLEDVGEQFGMTRERVRQIVKGAFERVRRSSGPILARALEALAKEHNASVVPITVPLLAQRLSTAKHASAWPELFYIYVLDRIAPFIPVWGLEIGHETLDESQRDEINSALEKWLPTKGEHPTAKEAFEHLRGLSKFGQLSVATFFSVLERARRIIVDFPRPQEPRLRLRRLRLFDVALPVLADSTEPLTPEKIIEQARTRFGADAVMLSGRTAENALAAHPDIFRLGPRSFGLRQHFVTLEADWPRLREQFIQLLRKENRPISTIEVCEKRSVALLNGINSYELAEILREDPRLIDLGRRLFSLAKWGVEDREHIKDLLPKILVQADRPLMISEIYDRLTKFRSATPTGLSNVLRDHPKIVRLEFQHYGLRSWGNSRDEFFVTKRSTVEKVVRRVDPPITFAELCKIFRIPAEGPAADLLWKSCAGSKRLRRAPDRRGEDTLLMHKAVSLEQALASIARTLARPAQAYELEWELRAKFGELFEKVRLQRIEERLDKSPRFLRNADGAFFLDADLDLGEFDVSAIRAAAAKVMLEDREILSSDDLLERLESQGFDLEGMTRGMLASVLRGNEELEEVGRERFRAK